MTISTDVARALLEIQAVRFVPEQPIRFKSGLLSPAYVDNRTLPYWPGHWQTIIDGFRMLIDAQRLAFDVIAGIEAAGIPHSAALGYATQQPSVFVRKQTKEHGTKSRVEGGTVAGKRVILVEDLVTTGGSSLSGIDALRAENAIVTDCLAIVSYGFAEAAAAFQRANVTLHTLTSFPVILEQGMQMDLFDADARAEIEDWLHAPHAWTEQREGLRTEL